MKHVSRKILQHPDERLRRKSYPVGPIDGRVRVLVAEMAVLMDEADGAGLAAIQVGEPLRLFLIASDVAGREEGALPCVFINPQLISHSDSTVSQAEGCLSFPGVSVPVRRYRRVHVRATDLAGATFDVKATGFYARALQHELEHLDGVLFTELSIKACAAARVRLE